MLPPSMTPKLNLLAAFMMNVMVLMFLDLIFVPADLILAHGIELSIESAQKGGAGLIVYNRKEGRALGEVTKFLVYNARKRQKGGDTAAKYFERTECVAGFKICAFKN